MYGFWETTKATIIQDFKAQFAPFRAIYNFIDKYKDLNTQGNKTAGEETAPYGFWPHTKWVIVQDFKAQLAPFRAIRNFINEYKDLPKQ